MTTVDLKLSLPEDLIREADAAGLLTSEAIEVLLRTELRQRRIERLFEAADRLADLPLPPMTEAEVEAEIDAIRAQRRATDAGSC